MCKLCIHAFNYSDNTEISWANSLQIKHSLTCQKHKKEERTQWSLDLIQAQTEEGEMFVVSDNEAPTATPPRLPVSIVYHWRLNEDFFKYSVV